MRKLLPLFLCVSSLFFSSSSFADTAKCRVQSAKPGSSFIPFVGGKAVMVLETGHLTVHSASETLVLADAERVSSFGASRAGCSFAWEKIVNGDELRSLLLKYNNCVHPDPSNPGFRKREMTWTAASAPGST